MKIRRFSGNGVFAVGLLVVCTIVGMTLLAPLIAPHDPIQSTGAARLSPPGHAHLMGTDQLQRDVLSRVLYGGRIPLVVASLSALIASTSGTILGWTAGYGGGSTDRFLALSADAVYSFPSLILTIAIVTMLGPGITTITGAIAFAHLPVYFRVARNQALVLREQDFVEAARALGSSHVRVLLRHISPNALPAVFTVVPVSIADAILSEAGLAFLGLGLPPPAADWGFDIQNGRKFLQAGYWWLLTFPGLMILLGSLGFEMMGEGISGLLSLDLDDSD
jgi:peptide/nickel transport system permease protein